MKKNDYWKKRAKKAEEKIECLEKTSKIWENKYKTLYNKINDFE